MSISNGRTALLLLLRRSGRMSLAAIALLLASALPAATAQACPNKCSGHGVCNNDGRCDCYQGFASADCSTRSCPTGVAWFSVPSDADVAHVEAECSNMGICDAAAGICRCREGFEGAACEKMACPAGCNGHGRCLSLRDAGVEIDDVALVRIVSYDEPWDADKIYGCVCDAGYAGYDCAQRTCPDGDDPLTTGQVDEVKQLTCTCSASPCMGEFTLTFRGQTTAPLSPDASPADLRAALLALPTVIDAAIVSESATLCDTTTVLTNITFTHNPGALPPLRVAVDDDLAGGTLEVNVTTLVVGTRENLPCSNRGICDVTTGLCQCELGFGPSDRRGAAGSVLDCGHQIMIAEGDDLVALNSTAGNATGTTAEVGDPLHPMVECWNRCSGHGFCSGAAGYVCTCYQGWAGADCSLRQCPFAPAWFAEPTSPLDAHSVRTECASKGSCERSTGRCACQSGWEGAACERLACPRARGGTCGGAGVCVTLAEAAALSRDSRGEPTPTTYGATAGDLLTWDAHRISGCVCDAGAYAAPRLTHRGWQRGRGVLALERETECLAASGACDNATASSCSTTTTTVGSDGAVSYTAAAEGGSWAVFMPGRTGFDCSLRECPAGSSVRVGGADEVQQLTCAADSGHLRLRFRSEWSDAVAFNATLQQLGDALQRLKSIGGVRVSSAEPVVCTGTPVSITFTSDFGDLPLLEPDDSSLGPVGGASAVVTEQHRGTKQALECSGHGVCDRALGLCRCTRGYASSDGAGARGPRPDCGASDAAAGAWTLGVGVE